VTDPQPLSAEELDELRDLAAVPHVRKELDISAWRYSEEPTFENAEHSGARRRFQFLQWALFDKALATIAAKDAEIAQLRAALERASSFVIASPPTSGRYDLLAEIDRLLPLGGQP